MKDFLAWDGWAFVGIALAAVAILATILAARAWGSRRGRLVYRVDVSRMVNAGTPAGVSITHRGVLLAEPWLATISLTNTGPRDITSANFHDGLPARIDIGSRVVVALDEQGSGPELDEVGTEVVIAPFHLPRKQRISFTCLVDGQPDRPSMTPLVDTDIELAQASMADGFREGLFGMLAAAFQEAAGISATVLFGKRRQT
ncbi:hypothetical protein [Isoptericola aurantiacus]|uniref:hypothetical protein n=1 Tax=Isoptericola aurantiacus TaxID=3377839 RepID=UPI00383B903C